MTSSGADILVILPTLGDRLDTLRETLLSVQAQSRDVQLQLVVVTPTTAHAARTLAAQFGATIVNDPGTGISRAINSGIAARRGEKYYAWIGDDDLFQPGGLRRLMNLMQETPEAVVAYGGCDYIDIHGNILAKSRAGQLAQVLLPWGPDLIPHPGSLIKLDDMQAVGLFDPDLKYAMDLDLFLKLRSRGKFVCTREAVSAFRWHPESLTVASRTNSGRESELVKSRYLPRALKPIRFLWVLPVRLASTLAAQRVTKRARGLLR